MFRRGATTHDRDNRDHGTLREQSPRPARYPPGDDAFRQSAYSQMPITGDVPNTPSASTRHPIASRDLNSPPEMSGPSLRKTHTRSRSSLEMSSSSTSSSLLDISRNDTFYEKLTNPLASFFKSPAEHRRHKKRKTRFMRQGNSSAETVSSDLAYGKGYIKRLKLYKKRSSSSCSSGSYRSRYSASDSSSRASSRRSDRGHPRSKGEHQNAHLGRHASESAATRLAGHIQRRKNRHKEARHSSRDTLLPLSDSRSSTRNRAQKGNERKNTPEEDIIELGRQLTELARGKSSIESRSRIRTPSSLASLLRGTRGKSTPVSYSALSGAEYPPKHSHSVSRGIEHSHCARDTSTRTREEDEWEDLDDDEAESSWSASESDSGLAYGFPQGSRESLNYSSGVMSEEQLAYGSWRPQPEIERLGLVQEDESFQTQARGNEPRLQEALGPSPHDARSSPAALSAHDSEASSVVHRPMRLVHPMATSDPSFVDVDQSVTTPTPTSAKYMHDAPATSRSASTIIFTPQPIKPARKEPLEMGATMLGDSRPASVHTPSGKSTEDATSINSTLIPSVNTSGSGHHHGGTLSAHREKYDTRKLFGGLTNRAISTPITPKLKAVAELSRSRPDRRSLDAQEEDWPSHDGAHDFELEHQRTAKNNHFLDDERRKIEREVAERERLASQELLKAERLRYEREAAEREREALMQARRDEELRRQQREAAERQRIAQIEAQRLEERRREREASERERVAALESYKREEQRRLREVAERERLAQLEAQKEKQRREAAERELLALLEAHRETERRRQEEAAERERAVRLAAKRSEEQQREREAAERKLQALLESRKEDERRRQQEAAERERAAQLEAKMREEQREREAAERKLKALIEERQEEERRRQAEAVMRERAAQQEAKKLEEQRHKHEEKQRQQLLMLEAEREEERRREREAAERERIALLEARREKERREAAERKLRELLEARRKEEARQEEHRRLEEGRRMEEQRVRDEQRRQEEQQSQLEERRRQDARHQEEQRLREEEQHRAKQSRRQKEIIRKREDSLQELKTAEREPQTSLNASSDAVHSLVATSGTRSLASPSKATSTAKQLSQTASHDSAGAVRTEDEVLHRVDNQYRRWRKTQWNQSCKRAETGAQEQFNHMDIVDFAEFDPPATASAAKTTHKKRSWMSPPSNKFDHAFYPSEVPSHQESSSSKASERPVLNIIYPTPSQSRASSPIPSEEVGNAQEDLPSTKLMESVISRSSPEAKNVSEKDENAPADQAQKSSSIAGMGSLISGVLERAIKGAGIQFPQSQVPSADSGQDQKDIAMGQPEIPLGPNVQVRRRKAPRSPPTPQLRGLNDLDDLGTEVPSAITGKGSFSWNSVEQPLAGEDIELAAAAGLGLRAAGLPEKYAMDPTLSQRHSPTDGLVALDSLTMPGSFDAVDSRHDKEKEPKVLKKKDRKRKSPKNPGVLDDQKTSQLAQDVDETSSLSPTKTPDIVNDVAGTDRSQITEPDSNDSGFLVSPASDESTSVATQRVSSLSKKRFSTGGLFSLLNFPDLQSSSAGSSRNISNSRILLADAADAIGPTTSGKSTPTSAAVVKDDIPRKAKRKRGHQRVKSLPDLTDLEFMDPEVLPRHTIKPAIDPEFGDLLPLPPSVPCSPMSIASQLSELPALPESRPNTPPDMDRDSKRRSLVADRKNSIISDTPVRQACSSPTAVPLNRLFKTRRQSSNPTTPAQWQSPAASPISQAVGRPSESTMSPGPRSRNQRPFSYDGREIRPFLLLENVRRSNGPDLRDIPDDLPALPPSVEPSETSSVHSSSGQDSFSDSGSVRSSGYPDTGDMAGAVYYGSHAIPPIHRLHLDTSIPMPPHEDSEYGSAESTPKAATFRASDLYPLHHDVSPESVIATSDRHSGDSLSPRVRNTRMSDPFSEYSGEVHDASYTPHMPQHLSKVVEGDYINIQPKYQHDDDDGYMDFQLLPELDRSGSPPTLPDDNINGKTSPQVSSLSAEAQLPSPATREITDQRADPSVSTETESRQLVNTPVETQTPQDKRSVLGEFSNAPSSFTDLPPASQQLREEVTKQLPYLDTISLMDPTPETSSLDQVSTLEPEERDELQALTTKSQKRKGLLSQKERLRLEELIARAHGVEKQDDDTTAHQLEPAKKKKKKKSKKKSKRDEVVVVVADDAADTPCSTVTTTDFDQLDKPTLAPTVQTTSIAEDEVKGHAANAELPQRELVEAGDKTAKENDTSQLKPELVPSNSSTVTRPSNGKSLFQIIAPLASNLLIGSKPKPVPESPPSRSHPSPLSLSSLTPSAARDMRQGEQTPTHSPMSLSPLKGKSSRMSDTNESSSHSQPVATGSEVVNAKPEHQIARISADDGGYDIVEGPLAEHNKGSSQDEQVNSRSSHSSSPASSKDRKGKKVVKFHPLTHTREISVSPPHISDLEEEEIDYDAFEHQVRRNRDKIDVPLDQAIELAGERRVGIPLEEALILAGDNQPHSSRRRSDKGKSKAESELDQHYMQYQNYGQQLHQNDDAEPYRLLPIAYDPSAEYSRHGYTPAYDWSSVAGPSGYQHYPQTPRSPPVMIVADRAIPALPQHNNMVQEASMVPLPEYDSTTSPSERQFSIPPATQVTTDHASPVLPKHDNVVLEASMVPLPEDDHNTSPLERQLSSPPAAQIITDHASLALPKHDDVLREASTVPLPEDDDIPSQSLWKPSDSTAAEIINDRASPVLSKHEDVLQQASMVPLPADNNTEVTLTTKNQGNSDPSVAAVTWSMRENTDLGIPNQRELEVFRPLMSSASNLPDELPHQPELDGLSTAYKTTHKDQGDLNAKHASVAALPGTKAQGSVIRQKSSKHDFLLKQTPHMILPKSNDSGLRSPRHLGHEIIDHPASIALPDSDTEFSEISEPATNIPMLPHHRDLPEQMPSISKITKTAAEKNALPAAVLASSHKQQKMLPKLSIHQTPETGRFDSQLLDLAPVNAVKHENFSANPTAERNKKPIPASVPTTFASRTFVPARHDSALVADESTRPAIPQRMVPASEPRPAHSPDVLLDPSSPVESAYDFLADPSSPVDSTHHHLLEMSSSPNNGEQSLTRSTNINGPGNQGIPIPAYDVSFVGSREPDIPAEKSVDDGKPKQLPQSTKALAEHSSISSAISKISQQEPRNQDSMEPLALAPAFDSTTPMMLQSDVETSGSQLTAHSAVPTHQKATQESKPVLHAHPPSVTSQIHQDATTLHPQSSPHIKPLPTIQKPVEELPSVSVSIPACRSAAEDVAASVTKTPTGKKERSSIEAELPKSRMEEKALDTATGWSSQPSVGVQSSKTKLSDPGLHDANQVEQSLSSSIDTVQPDITSSSRDVSSHSIAQQEHAPWSSKRLETSRSAERSSHDREDSFNEPSGPLTSHNVLDLPISPAPPAPEEPVRTEAPHPRSLPGASDNIIPRKSQPSTANTSGATTHAEDDEIAVLQAKMESRKPKKLTKKDQSRLNELLLKRGARNGGAEAKTKDETVSLVKPVKEQDSSMVERTGEETKAPIPERPSSAIRGTDTASTEADCRAADSRKPLENIQRSISPSPSTATSPKEKDVKTPTADSQLETVTAPPMIPFADHGQFPVSAVSPDRPSTAFKLDGPSPFIKPELPSQREQYEAQSQSTHQTDIQPLHDTDASIAGGASNVPESFHLGHQEPSRSLSKQDTPKSRQTSPSLGSSSLPTKHGSTAMRTSQSQDALPPATTTQPSYGKERSTTPVPAVEQEVADSGSKKKKRSKKKKKSASQNTVESALVGTPPIVGSTSQETVSDVPHEMVSNKPTTVSAPVVPDPSSSPVTEVAMHDTVVPTQTSKPTAESKVTSFISNLLARATHPRDISTAEPVTAENKDSTSHPGWKPVIDNATTATTSTTGAPIIIPGAFETEVISKPQSLSGNQDSTSSSRQLAPTTSGDIGRVELPVAVPSTEQETQQDTSSSSNSSQKPKGKKKPKKSPTSATDILTPTVTGPSVASSALSVKSAPISQVVQPSVQDKVKDPDAGSHELSLPQTRAPAVSNLQDILQDAKTSAKPAVKPGERHPESIVDDMVRRRKRNLTPPKSASPIQPQPLPLSLEEHSAKARVANKALAGSTQGLALAVAQQTIQDSFQPTDKSNVISSRGAEIERQAVSQLALDSRDRSIAAPEPVASGKPSETDEHLFNQCQSQDDGVTIFKKKNRNKTEGAKPPSLPTVESASGAVEAHNIPLPLTDDEDVMLPVSPGDISRSTFVNEPQVPIHAAFSSVGSRNTKQTPQEKDGQTLKAESVVQSDIGKSATAAIAGGISWLASKIGGQKGDADLEAKSDAYGTKVEEEHHGKQLEEKVSSEQTMQVSKSEVSKSNTGPTKEDEVVEMSQKDARRHPGKITKIKNQLATKKEGDVESRKDKKDVLRVLGEERQAGITKGDNEVVKEEKEAIPITMTSGSGGAKEVMVKKRRTTPVNKESSLAVVESQGVTENVKKSAKQSAGKDENTVSMLRPKPMRKNGHNATIEAGIDKKTASRLDLLKDDVTPSNEGKSLERPLRHEEGAMVNQRPETPTIPIDAGKVRLVEPTPDATSTLMEKDNKFLTSDVQPQPQVYQQQQIPAVDTQQAAKAGNIVASQPQILTTHQLKHQRGFNFRQDQAAPTSQGTPLQATASEISRTMSRSLSPVHEERAVISDSPARPKSAIPPTAVTSLRDLPGPRDVKEDRETLRDSGIDVTGFRDSSTPASRRTSVRASLKLPGTAMEYDELPLHSQHTSPPNQLASGSELGTIQSRRLRKMASVVGEVPLSATIPPLATSAIPPRVVEEANQSRPRTAEPPPLRRVSSRSISGSVVPILDGPALRPAGSTSSMASTARLHSYSGPMGATSVTGLVTRPSSRLGVGSTAPSPTPRLQTPDPTLHTQAPSTNSSRGGVGPTLRGKRTSGDLRALSASRISSPSQLSLASNASSVSGAHINNTPVANEGRIRSRSDMGDVYEAVGEGRIGSPRSPTRPPSIRRRQSMQVMELESRVDQLLAENRALQQAHVEAEHAMKARAAMAAAERDAEIEQLQTSLSFLQREVARLTEINDGLSSANGQLALQHNDRTRRLETDHATASHELDTARATNRRLEGELAQKDGEIAKLRAELELTKRRIRDMQEQLLAANRISDKQFLSLKDIMYFDKRCQQLCSHAQQWVLRFSKFSDMRACRLTSEMEDEQIIDRLDNTMLDGTEVDEYLSDRVRRRDVFMSVVMTMIWEYVFTRYLFGMDREQRQKLKALEKMLAEVGPVQAVRQWRAVTLTILSKRPSFKAQRDQDTEAVVQAILQTLSMVLSPPTNLEEQVHTQLRRVVRDAVNLAIEMRTQRCEYMMLPPTKPQYDDNGDLVEKVAFDANYMAERSGDANIPTAAELEASKTPIRVQLFPLVVRKGDDDGIGDDEVIVFPAQVLVESGLGRARSRSRSRSRSKGPPSAFRGSTPVSELGSTSMLGGHFNGSILSVSPQAFDPLTPPAETELGSR